ncbi:TraR/DksA C4-type zinc finger protein [Janthinobacterium aquaticum]|uniref:TraR/DksA C4-type zinc finger protein n=1 Tax=Janthinobacterium sp. FT58W TaxID=2654254 RepID=UPI001263FBD2|nr:TraR/DksA C4-type zinc finger protein [Janthinobacterium sp. FT58W]KAB8037396.1 TraR/DksA family transcriptional regulator [Janthinobacterium sp. FT58W]
MTDISDRATEVEEIARLDAIRDQSRRAGLAGKSVADSATDCSVCDEPIAEKRRQAVPGVQTCIECQEELERASHANGGRP